VVRRRYDTLSLSFITFIEKIVKRCEDNGCAVSFCGEDAGRPVEALTFVAAGIRTLSMRPAAIGPVKDLIRRADLTEVAAIIEKAKAQGEERLRPLIMAYVRSLPPA